MVPGCLINDNEIGSQNSFTIRELFIVYHIHTDPQNPSGDRQVCIDRMGFREDGSLYVTGPTQTPQLIPSSKE
jgi:hypothetical protein